MKAAVLSGVGGDFELQRADRPEQHGRIAQRAKHLNRAFFTQLHQAGAQLLDLERIHHFDRVKNFRSKKRQTSKL